MSTKVGITAENYKVSENFDRTTSDSETGLNKQQEKSDGLKIHGLALPFGKRSRNGVIYEKESVQEAAETLVGCSLLFNHDENNPIGHIEDVKVKEDGLYYIGDLNEEKREVDSLKRGDIPHVSIQAMVDETAETQKNGVVGVKSFLEMSAVTVPGFSRTDIETEETVKIEKLVEDKIQSVESLENPEFSVGDFLRWDFAGGSAEGEVYDMKTEVGDSMSAGGNSFTIEEGDGPLYKLQEWDDEQEKFTNAVVKFEDALREVERPDAAPGTAPRNESLKSEQDWKVHTPAYDEAVLTNWDGVDRSEFNRDQEFKSVHVVEHGDEVHLPVAHKEDGVLKLVYEALNSAFDLAENIEGIPMQTVDNARDVLQMIRQDEFPDQPALNADSQENSSKEPFQGFDDFEDCVQTMMDEEGHDRDSAEKICGAIKKRNEIKAKNEALSDVDLTPPDRVKNAAQAALDWEEENPDRQDCGTGVGDSRANSITNETLSPEDFLGGENTAIPDYLESHEEDVTAEGPPTDWSDEEMNDCGNRQYAKWGFYLDWFKEKEQELKQAKEETLNNIKGELTTMTEQTNNEQLEEVNESDFHGTIADMYEGLGASDVAQLMKDFEFSDDPEPLVAQVADLADMTPADLIELLESEMEETEGDMDDDEEDEAGDMDDDEEDDMEDESFNKNKEKESELQDGDKSSMSEEEKSKEELRQEIENLKETVRELEGTEDSKQEKATGTGSEESDIFKDDFKNRLLQK